MAKWLLQAGCDVNVYNRSRSKAEPLTEYGGNVVDSPRDLDGCDIVFSMVSTGKDLTQLL